MEPMRARRGLTHYAGRKQVGTITPSWWNAEDMASRLGIAVVWLFASRADDVFGRRLVGPTDDVCRVCILPGRVEVAIEVLRDETDEQAAKRVAAILAQFEKAGSA